MPYFQLFSLKGTTGRSRTKENPKVLSWYLRSGLPFQPSLTLPLRISSRKRSTSLQVLIKSNQIKSNHFYCHITTAQVPWWVKFLWACSRQCKKTTDNLPMDRQCKKTTNNLPMDRQCKKTTNNLPMDRQCKKTTNNLPMDRQCKKTTNNLHMDRQCKKNCTEHLQCSRQCKKNNSNLHMDRQCKKNNSNLHMDRQCKKQQQFTYGQYIFTDCTEDNAQNTHTYTQYAQCTTETHSIINDTLIYQVEIFRYYFRSCWSRYTTELFQLYLMHTEKQFWVYTGNEVLGPRKIEKLGLPSNLDRVDGSVQRGKGKVLLFNGENFWRYVNSASEL